MAEDKLEQVKGNIKETVGDATNNDNLEQEGKKDKASGKAKEVIDNVKDKASDVVAKSGFSYSISFISFMGISMVSFPSSLLLIIT